MRHEWDKVRNCNETYDRAVDRERKRERERERVGCIALRSRSVVQIAVTGSTDANLAVYLLDVTNQPLLMFVVIIVTFISKKKHHFSYKSYWQHPPNDHDRLQGPFYVVRMAAQCNERKQNTFHGPATVYTIRLLTDRIVDRHNPECCIILRIGSGSHLT
jgi:hypothetical protein